VSVLGHYLGAAIEFMLRDMTRILAALEDVNHCPMGAAAITTSGFDLDRHRVAELLGFPAIVENSYGAIANVDYITASYASIRLGCIHLGRLVQDLVTWTGFEVSQIDVADGFVQISSIMPQKRNPVPLEHLRLKFSLAAGGADQIVQTMHNTPFADMNDSERETQATGFAVFDRLDHALPLLGTFVEAMKTNRASINSRIQKSMATITELADTLVRAEGIGFRAGASCRQQTGTSKRCVSGSGLMSCHGTCLPRRLKSGRAAPSRGSGGAGNCDQSGEFCRGPGNARGAGAARPARGIGRLCGQAGRPESRDREMFANGLRRLTSA
jgi:argininosuccinate lyase